jgi:hypothetical protein
MDEMEIKALTDEGQQHGDEDEEECAFWSEVEVLAGKCFNRAHKKPITIRITIKIKKKIGSCGDRRGGEMAFTWIGGGNDDADGFLVESFEAAMAL